MCACVCVVCAIALVLVGVRVRARVRVRVRVRVGVHVCLHVRGICVSACLRVCVSARAVLALCSTSVCSVVFCGFFYGV